MSENFKMWTDCEHLVVIYQIKIKVITTKGNADRSPSVTWIYLKAELKKFAELSDFDINDMVLFHENDYHFNLVVNKDSDLASLGSLSYRYNFGPLLVNTDESDN